MKTPFEKLVKANAENQKQVTVNVGVLKAALSQIESYSDHYGKHPFTDATVFALEAAIKRAV